MQLYDRGIRRRLAPMLGNDRRKLELAFSLLFSLPGTPMMQYGDEIGIGDDLRLPERECARTPMQWTDDTHGGFSRAREGVRPVINDRSTAIEKVNVAAQRRDSDSLLNWTERIIRTRKECPRDQLGRLRRPAHQRARGAGHPLRLARHVAADAAQFQQRDAARCGSTSTAANDGMLVDVFDDQHSKAHSDGAHRIDLERYAWRWFRVGGADNSLDRSDLDLTNPMR